MRSVFLLNMTFILSFTLWEYNESRGQSRFARIFIYLFYPKFPESTQAFHRVEGQTPHEGRTTTIALHERVIVRSA